MTEQSRGRRLLDAVTHSGPGYATRPYPPVQGRCPSCGGEALFLGEGGYVTCARLNCPEPDAVSTLLGLAGEVRCSECGTPGFCIHKLTAVRDRSIPTPKETSR